MISGSRFNIASEVSRQRLLSREIAQLQTDISTGVRVHVASDDPAAAGRIAQIRATQANEGVWAQNVTTATAVSSLVDTSLSGIQTNLVRAKELMLSASNGTLNASDRAAIAAELQGIADDIATAGQATDSSGQPLYAAGTPLAIPVGRATSVAAQESFSTVFGGVALSGGGSGSIAEILSSAIAAVRSGDAAAIKTGLADVDAAGTHITDAQADAGVRAARIIAAGERLADSKTDLADERSGLEDTDATEAYATLSAKMTTLSAAQSVLAKLGQTSLFDKLG